ncbi:ABC transporter permease subunit [Streptomyces sp. NPDC051133]|uniref:ABC transporter permease n=1 Tax=Streptomyces sp. NPDC051133 TaxID=3155521 RepID=UPI00342FCA26
MGFALIIATVLGMAAGIAMWRSPTASSLAKAVAGVFLNVPCFVLFGLLVPLLGFGRQVTAAVLLGYSLLPIVRSTITGLQGVRPDVVQAAQAVGMRRSLIVVKIQLPLAWPAILMGIRFAAQLTIAIAAITAYIAGPVHGEGIFDGPSRVSAANVLNQALVGICGIAALSALNEFAFVVLRRFTTPRGLRV